MGESWCLGVSSVGLVVSGLYRGDSGLGWHMEREGGEGSREVDGGDEGGEAVIWLSVLPPNIPDKAFMSSGPGEGCWVMEGMKGSSRKPLLSDWQLLVLITHTAVVSDAPM